jgi:hypothetical protein
VGSISRSASQVALFALFVAACSASDGGGGARPGTGIADSGLRDAVVDAARIWDLGPPDAAPPPHDAAPLPDAAPPCAPPGTAECVPGEPEVVRFCPGGGHWIEQICPEGRTCRDGACTVPGADCEQGQRTCLGDTQPATCDPGNGWRMDAACAEGERCFRGECLNADCAAAAEQHSYLGCDYWPVDLPTTRYSGPGTTHTDSPLGVILVNPDAAQPAHVTAYGPDGTVGSLVATYDMTPPVGDSMIPVQMYQAVHLQTQVHGSDGGVILGAFDHADHLEVPPGGMLRLLLPHDAPTDRHSGIARTAWRVQSDRPMAAYQFSPLCCNYSFSNDASLLLPASALGTGYRFIGVPSQGGSTQAMTIVALTDDTRVHFTFPADAVAQSDPAGHFVLDVDDLHQATVRLAAHEVLTVQAGYGPLTAVQRDLTGTLVESSMPVAVFSSHQCARYPDGTAACDHLEEQLFPIGTWGRQFVLMPPADRGHPAPETEATWWRVLADRDGAQVRLGEPFAALAAQPPGNLGTPDCAMRLADPQTLSLGPGESCELGTRHPIYLDATAPVLVMGIMGGQGTTGIESPYGARAGDPSMFLAPPVRQYRDDYEFLTPSTYALNYVTLVAPPGATLTLDGAALSLDGGVAVPGDTHLIHHVALRRGAHHLTGSAPFGILLYAYDDFVSYAFTGGLDLRKE